MSIFGVRIGSGITVESGITITSQLPPNQGETVAYTRNTYFNTGPNGQQSGITTTSSLPGFGGPIILYQLCYAWQTTAVVTQVGMNCYQALSFRTGPLYVNAIGSSPNNLNAITPNNLMGYDLTQRTFTAGEFVTPQQFVGMPDIPANTYFLLSVSAFEGVTTYDRPLNRTALVSGSPFVTFTNMIFYSTAGSDSNGTPTQVGGTSPGYVFREGSSMVASWRFR